jgi:aminodeoxyfutalosine deaminase
MNPVSNIKTGAVASLDEHPIRRYVDAGLLVTVNSDDPPMFGTSLTHEYEVLASRLGFSREELKTLSLNGIRASFLPPEEKEAMIAVFEHEFNYLPA